MTIHRFVLRELQRRKVNFAVGLFSVVVAVASLVAALVMLRAHDAETRRILGRAEQDLQHRIGRLNEEVREAMAELGFNIVILPRSQQLADWYAEDYAAETMPESYAGTLADAGLVTIEHLVARLRHRVKWPETEWTVIIVGTAQKAEQPSPSISRTAIDAVPAGRVVLGHEIHRGLDLKEGDELRLFGQAFTVLACRPERGTGDDITVWMDLADAQRLLDKPGRINEILALECRTAWSDLPKVRAEVARILPDTQVIEKTSLALAKTQARRRVEQDGRASLRRERENRAGMRQARAQLTALLVPVMLALCTVWIGLLALGNVRERRAEIGVLRAMGFRSQQVLALFLSRSFTMGILGGFIGFLAGVLACGQPGSQAANADLLGPALATALAVSLAATWLPASRAARQDPAVALQEE